jgi:hypothetical protein
MSAYGTGVVGIGISSSYTATRLNVVDNALAGSSMVDLTSTSTAAAGSLQKILNISLTGANTNASERTYGAYISNTHTGTNPFNTGLYAEVSGGPATRGVHGVNLGTGAGVRGDGAWGVYATSSSGSAFQGIANGIANGIYAEATDALTAHFVRNPASTNTAEIVLQLTRQSQGTSANGIGSIIEFHLSNDAGTGAISNQIISTLTNAVAASATSSMTINGLLSTVIVNVATFNADGSWQIRPITATAASAITPAEGMQVFVSNTNGTFTSIGFWGYQNGAWHAF